MSSTDSLDLPIAAVVCLGVGSYVLLIGIILLVRYFLVSRGVCECNCSCGKEDAEDQQSCGCCVSLAECCNCCQNPNLTSCLDSICPNRKRIGCVEILLCQCCGSEGAAGMCAGRIESMSEKSVTYFQIAKIAMSMATKLSEDFERFSFDNMLLIYFMQAV